jgi:dTDP-4-amino-4,6-dideoxygalactose transaminase
LSARFIPFNRFCSVGTEFAYVQQAIESMHVSGDGTFTARVHAMFEQEFGVNKALLTTSCTHALEMAALLLNLQPKDEVILPSFTFVSTVNAFILRGAKPVFADIRPDTLNIDERQLESLITPSTRAIVVVHYAGVGCNMDAIMEIAERHGLPVVEDNAHGLFGKYRGRYLGTFGCMATQSFHETKNISCGEGGALLINNAAYAQRAEIIREKGTNRKQYIRGEVDRYTWVDVGSSYLPSEILAAILYAQLEHREQIQQARSTVWRRYAEELAPWACYHGVSLPITPHECDHPAHLFYMLMPSSDERDALIANLRGQDILTVFHYQPLHLSPMGRRFGGKDGDCPVSEDVSQRLVRLPLFNGLTDSDQSRVINAIKDSRRGQHKGIEDKWGRPRPMPRVVGAISPTSTRQ